MNLDDVQKVIASPRYHEVPTSTKGLLLAVVLELVNSWEKSSAEQIRQILKESMATPQQQIKAIEKVVMDTLYKPKAERRMRAVASACISETVFPQDHEGLNSEVPHDYHSVTEIRTLITDHISEIRDYFGTRELPLSAFSDHIQRYTTLRPGDETRVSNGRKRWNQQVGSAIHSSYWQDCPIISTNVRGTYILRPEQ